MKHLIVAVALLIAGPAFADTDDGVTLTLENDAGMVTTIPGLTNRECNAIEALLAARHANGLAVGYSNGSALFGVLGNCYSTCSPTPNGGNALGTCESTCTPPPPRTSALTKTACVRATDQKK